MSPTTSYHASRIAISAALVASAAVVALPMRGATAQTEPTSEGSQSRARELFNQGVEQYEAGHYQSALASFQEAYRLKPHPAVHVNMANCYSELGKPLQAIFHFRRFLDLMGDDTDPTQRREVEQALQELRQKVGELRLEVAPDGATVHVDDAETRQAPILEPIRLEAGEHVVLIEEEGFQPVRRTVEVPGGGHVKLSVRLERPAIDAVASGQPPADADDEPQPPEPPTSQGVTPSKPEPSPEEGGLRITLPTAIAGTATASALLAALVTGIMARHFQSEYDDALPKSSTLDLPSCQAGNRNQCLAEQDRYYEKAWDAAQRANSLALATDMLLGASLVGAGVTVYFFIQDQQGDAPVDEGLVVSPAVSPTRAGLDVRGRF